MCFLVTYIDHLLILKTYGSVEPLLYVLYIRHGVPLHTY